ncbi:hypothetical protein ENSA5_63170 [Enhygromyxa salina]|uniref:Uncharacterized protein n=1 Tax=Enhygromyxa salina TaxID=215803 RepID=A0A2S9XCR5_9BACT|nr:hypothetical protein ENSA5_63170 [Enhygromyxa salina]
MTPAAVSNFATHGRCAAGRSLAPLPPSVGWYELRNRLRGPLKGAIHDPRPDPVDPIGPEPRCYS